MKLISRKKETKTKGFRVLVVDDEEEICYILNKYFSMDGHMVKTVNNGADAIKLIEKEEFDIVLSDMVIPDICGSNVIMALNYKTDKRPIIGMMTGSYENKESLEGEGLKVDFIINKPFKLSDLTKHINEAVVSRD